MCHVFQLDRKQLVITYIGVAEVSKKECITLIDVWVYILYQVSKAAAFVTNCAMQPTTKRTSRVLSTVGYFFVMLVSLMFVPYRSTRIMPKNAIQFHKFFREIDLTGIFLNAIANRKRKL